MARARATALAVALGVAAGGCGGGDDDAGVPVTTTPGSPAPATTAQAPTATTGVPSPPDEGGDEEPIRVPAAFTLDGQALTPAVVTVPPFLAVEVRLTAADGRAHDVRIDAPGGGPVALAAGGTARVRLAGLQPGEYPVIADGGALRATLRVARDAVGP